MLRVLGACAKHKVSSNIGLLACYWKVKSNKKSELHCATQKMSHLVLNVNIWNQLCHLVSLIGITNYATLCQ